MASPNTICSCVIATLGGLMGILMGCAFLQMLHQLNSQMFQVGIVDMLGPWLLYMLLLAAAIGFVSGIVPAIRAAQLSVVKGLRQVV